MLILVFKWYTNKMPFNQASIFVNKSVTKLSETHKISTSDGDELSLAVQTYHQLSDMILSGGLAYGDLVSERRLAEELSVSRTPVREAIGRLEAEGLLERRGGRIIVREVRLKEFVEILHIRKLLESDAARLAARQANPATLKMVRTAIEAILEAEQVSAEQLRQADDQFHNFVANSSGNKMMAEQITELRKRTAMFDHERLPGRLRPGNSEHLKIIDLISNGDSEGAAQAMAKHIDNVQDSIFDHWKS
jgi:DNA-binding GntR family transcriptional regulator